MPMYSYKCESCRHQFDVRHGMFFEDQRCVKCNSDEVFRLPGLSERQSSTPTNTSNKPGKIVKDYIEKTKEEVKQYKKTLSDEEL